ncbi:MAG: hypothetical protein CVU56_12930 [Deltaproteobacteria bacterium HGW-Deltaproteobacteria-14]|jgi:hypothetical protein|nr:MAG: hypothetical protein CVU56_12930 [Deltaproteobacteria bacterium HGW-Deltaproteobacteria-14]
MNSVSNGSPHPDLMVVGGRARTNEAAAAAAPSRADRYRMAEQRVRRGRRLVICGFVVAVAGIVAYCVVGLGAAAGQELGATALASPGWLAGLTLGAIGLGTLLWLIGSLVYFNAAMDSDPSGPDLPY